jgi:3-oxoadipate enol-lactonase
MNFARANGITLHLLEEGIEENLPLVFVNSLGTDLRLWDSVARYFTDDFRVIRYDKRGHGLSDCPPAPYSIRDHAEDLAGLLDALRLSHAILVGISVGGMIALDFAARYPERVKALVLCDTGAKIGTVESWNARIQAVQRGGMESIADGVLARWFMPPFAKTYPAQVQGFRNMLTRTPAEGYIGTCVALRDAELSEAAKAVRAKTLVLCGSHDVATPPELTRGLLDVLPDARHAELPDAAHLPCVEQPERFTEIMMQFLRDNGYVG